MFKTSNDVGFYCVHKNLYKYKCFVLKHTENYYKYKLET